MSEPHWAEECRECLCCTKDNHFVFSRTSETVSSLMLLSAMLLIKWARSFTLCKIAIKDVSEILRHSTDETGTAILKTSRTTPFLVLSKYFTVFTENPTNLSSGGNSKKGPLVALYTALGVCWALQCCGNICFLSFRHVPCLQTWSAFEMKTGCRGIILAPMFYGVDCQQHASDPWKQNQPVFVFVGVHRATSSHWEIDR